MAHGSWAGCLKFLVSLVKGATLAELEDNIQDAYRLMIQEQETLPVEGSVQSKEIEVRA